MDATLADHTVDRVALPARDRCPGLLDLHPAADGMLARLRLPGGRVRSDQLVAIADLAARGNGIVELTARANVQVRGLRDEGAEGPAPTFPQKQADQQAPGLSEGAARAFPRKPAAAPPPALAAASLLPSPAHERVRNVIASPLGGRHPAAVLAVDEIVVELDRGLCGDPTLAALPGRIRFLVEDGSGALAGLGHDFALVPCPDGRAALLVDGVDSGRRAAGPQPAAGLALEAARAFVAAARRLDRAWSVRELPEGAAGVIARLGAGGTDAGGAVDARRVLDGAVAVHAPRAEGEDAPHPPPPWPTVAPSPLPPGRTGQRDGRVALTALAPLGRLSEAQLRALAALAPEVRVSPWRTVTVLDVPAADAPAVERALAGLGLVLDADSGWAGLSACAGLGACASARADVRGAAAARVLVRGPGAPAEHWAACHRRCGELPGTPVTVAVLDGGVAVREDDRETLADGLEGALATLDGAQAAPEGALATLDGAQAAPEGALATLDGAQAAPEGALATLRGAQAAPEGSLATLRGAQAALATPGRAPATPEGPE